MFNRIKKLFKKENKLEKDFIFAGHVFRVLDPKHMTVSRQRALYNSSHERDLGIMPDKYKEALKTVSESLKAPKQFTTIQDLNGKQADIMANARAVLEDLVFLHEQDHQYEPFVKAACVFILIDDEQQSDDPFGKYFDKKIELLKKHSEIEDFFLTIGVGYHRSTISSWDTSQLWEFYPTKAIKRIESRISKVIQSEIYSYGSQTEKS